MIQTNKEEENKKQEQIEKDLKILKETKRLKAAFKNIPPDKKKCIEKLFDKAAFMAITLEDLQNIIKRDGYTNEYQNGQNQFGTKKSPEIEIYNTMVKNYSTVMRDLVTLLPNKEKDIEDDEVLSFIKNQPSISKGEK